MRSWLLAGGEVVTGAVLFVGLVLLVAVLRPPIGTLQERRILRFPGAWMIVGLALTGAFCTSFALVAVGLRILH